MSEWSDVRKAVAPDLERAPTKPPEIPATDQEFARGMKHDGERMLFESLLYVFLKDAGWSSEGLSDCVMWDTWLHPTSVHSGKLGHELVNALGFNPVLEFAKLEALLRRAGA